MNESTAMYQSQINAQADFINALRRKIHRRTVKTIKSVIREMHKQGNTELELHFKDCLRVYRTGYDL